MTGLPKQGVVGEQPIVVIVEDDTSFRDALRRLFHTVDLRTEVFGSAAELLENKLPDVPACLILDVRLPGLSGLDIQRELAKASIEIPIIFMTGHGDIPMSVKAMKAGAVDFLTKPFRDQDLLDAVFAAIERDRRRREQASALAELRAGRGDGP
jgi:FixJ family two-component response regulator